jgi:hypothetical protein
MTQPDSFDHQGQCIMATSETDPGPKFGASKIRAKSPFFVSIVTASLKHLAKLCIACESPAALRLHAYDKHPRILYEGTVPLN